jgi:hypothetical protein
VLQNAASNSVVLRWRAVPDRSYSLETTTDLGRANWTIIATNVTAAGPFAEFVEANPTNTTQFYRVRLNP